MKRVEQIPTSGQPEAELHLDGASVGGDDLLRWSELHGADTDSDSGGLTCTWLLERAATAMCVQEAGACKAAVEMTAALHE